MIYLQFIKKVLKWLRVYGAIISTIPCSFVQANNNKDQSMSMEKLIDSLLVVIGQEYLDKEILLRQGSSQAIMALKTRLNDKDPFAKLYTNTLLKWMEGRSPNNDAALKYLEDLPAELAMTPISDPPPAGVASYLSLHYQSSVANILAIHLLKLPDLPYWRTAAILLYLEEQKSHEVTNILLRFVSETKNEDFKNVVLNTIDATKDPLLNVKILEEEIRLKSLKLVLPPSLKSRLSKP